MKLLKSMFNKQFLLIILCMVTIVVFVVWWHVKPNAKAVQASKQVVEIAEAIRKDHIGKPDYRGFDTNKIAGNTILTNTFYKDNRLVNALGKPILAGQGEQGNMIMPGGKSFDIVYTELSMEECLALATYDYEQKDELGLLTVTIISGNNSQEFGWGRENNQLPIGRTDARNICGDNSKIVWTLE